MPQHRVVMFGGKAGWTNAPHPWEALLWKAMLCTWGGKEANWAPGVALRELPLSALAAAAPAHIATEQ